jgi:hypothetical protein
MTHNLRLAPDNAARVASGAVATTELKILRSGSAVMMLLLCQNDSMAGKFHRRQSAWLIIDGNDSDPL